VAKFPKHNLEEDDISIFLLKILKRTIIKLVWRIQNHLQGRLWSSESDPSILFAIVNSFENPVSLDDFTRMLSFKRSLNVRLVNVSEKKIDSSG